MSQLIFIAFFNGFGHVFPLFDRADFDARFAKQYPITMEEDVAWYANLNIVFAIGSVMREREVIRASPPNPQSPRYPRAEHSVWWKWFRNATSTFIELQFREGSLGAVQAMVGMVTTMNSRLDKRLLLTRC